jgi:hypothetical protein
MEQELGAYLLGCALILILLPIFVGLGLFIGGLLAYGHFFG